MATRKLYDLAVKVGEYEQNGKTKGRYQNVGAVMESDQGGKFIFLDRFFNPAGVPNPDNRANVILSMFEPQQREGQDAPRQSSPAPSEDIPF